MDVVAALVVVVALGALAVLASRAVARRLGFPLVLLAALALVLTALEIESVPAVWASAATFVLVLGFWLVDRGIPGNRPRPGWLVIGGVLMLLASILTTLAVVAPLQN